ncbi:MAG TPA: TRAP transporter substrate-binding protein [Gammaproteobacteria bacterium]|nr:TRAP transporter substrate-binding protein [Gammaproteobacteria bacterium]
MTKFRAYRLAHLIALLPLVPGAAVAERFRMGLPTPPSHVWTIEANAFARSLEQRSGGEHTVEVYPASQLGNDAQMLQQLQTGALDMVFMPIAELTNRLPELGALYAPYLADDVESSARLLKSDEANALLDGLPARIGVVGLGFALGGMRQIVTRGPVSSVASLSGLKLRVTPLEPIRDFYLLLGAAPIPLPIASVYDALANGQIDAIDMDLENTWKQKYYELGETVILSNHMMFPMVGLVSAVKWRTLDPETRQLIDETMNEHFDRIIATYIEAEAEYERELRNAGIEILEVGPEFFGSAIDEWEARWRERAPALSDLRRLADRRAD